MRQTVRHIILTLIFLLPHLLAAAQADYATTAVKAQRFFDFKEWASAQALYELMLDEKPTADSVYVKAIVASSMLNQEKRASELLARAMTAGVGFSKLMAGIQDVSFSIGEPSVYESFLIRSQRDCPWLQRAIDNELLEYYSFRDNGERMAAYASKMLAGLPDSIKYMSMLAKAYTLCGRFDDAVTVWRKILAISPDDYDTLLNIGFYMNITDRKTEALEYLKQARSIRKTPYITETINEIQSQLQ